MYQAKINMHKKLTLKLNELTQWISPWPLGTVALLMSSEHIDAQANSYLPLGNMTCVVLMLEWMCRFKYGRNTDLYWLYNT